MSGEPEGTAVQAAQAGWGLGASVSEPPPRSLCNWEQVGEVGEGRGKEPQSHS